MAASFSPSVAQPAAINHSADFKATVTFPAIDFEDGIALVCVAPVTGTRTPTSVTIGGTEATRQYQTTAAGDQSLWTLPISEGSYDVVLTLNVAHDHFAIMSGTLIGVASEVPVSTAQFGYATVSSPVATTSSITVPTDGIGIASAVMGGSAPRAASTGTQIATGMNGFRGGSGNLGILAEQATAGAWTPTFTAASSGSSGIVAAAWEPSLGGGGTVHDGASALTGSGAVEASASAARKGTSAVSGTSSLTATATLTKSGAAVLNGTSTLATTASRTTTGSAALTGAGAVTTTARLTARGAANFNGTGTLAGSALRTLRATTALTGTGTLTATGETAGTLTGAAALEGNGTLAASATVNRHGSASLTGTGTLNAAGETGSSLPGEVALAGTGAFSATATITRGGSASLIGRGAISASLSADMAAGAVLVGSGGLDALARLEANAAAALAGVGTLTALGRSEAPRVATVLRPSFATYSARPSQQFSSRPRAVSTGRR